MEITLNTPALLFPAISLIMLAHTNRFLALSNRVRSLHSKYLEGSDEARNIHGQIRNLKYRLRIIKNMQALGILSFICCIICMFFLYIDYLAAAEITFAVSLVLFIISLLMSLQEVHLSTRAIEIELSDMEDLEDPSLVKYIKKKFEK